MVATSLLQQLSAWLLLLQPWQIVAGTMLILFLCTLGVVIVAALIDDDTTDPQQLRERSHRL